MISRGLREAPTEFPAVEGGDVGGGRDDWRSSELDAVGRATFLCRRLSLIQLMQNGVKSNTDAVTNCRYGGFLLGTVLRRLFMKLKSKG
jgi:hypothetical protein